MIEYTSAYEEKVKDLLVELQEYLAWIDSRKVIVLKENYREDYFKHVMSEVDKHSGKVFLAEKGNRIVGLVVCKILQGGGEAELTTSCPKIGFISDLIVTRNERGCGFGGALITAAEEYFAQNGCEYTQLEVFAPNASAFDIYRMYGYNVNTYYMSKSKKLRRELMKKYNQPPFELLKDYKDNGINHTGEETNKCGISFLAYPQEVGLKTVMRSESFYASKEGSLVFALGQRDDQISVCPDLARLRNVMLVGAPGSGKTTCIYAMLSSLLYKISPEDLQLLLIEPNNDSSLSIFDGIPHMLTEHVVKEEKNCVAALEWAIKEMERRYDKFFFRTVNGKPTRNLHEYNCSLGEGEKKLPHIVIVVESFWGMDEDCKNDFEPKLLKLVQKSVASGIHVVIATQEPFRSREGRGILNAIGTKIVFQLRCADESEAVLGSNLAVYLRGAGDMLYRAIHAEPLRVRGCMVSCEEVKQVVDYIKSENNSFAIARIDDYISDFEPIKIPEEILKIIEEEDEGDEQQANSSPEETENDAVVEEEPLSGREAIKFWLTCCDDEDEEDEEDEEISSLKALNKKALKFSIEQKKISIALLHDTFGIGYLRASKIISNMLKAGFIVQEAEDEWKVLLTKDEFMDIYGKENMYITIVLWSMAEWKRVEIDCNNEIVELISSTSNSGVHNKQTIDLNVKEFVSRLLEITSSWEPKMTKYRVWDGLDYTVSFSTNERLKEYRGQFPNSVPKNFREFRNLLEDYKIW